MIHNIILFVVSLAGVTYIFIKKFGWKATGIIMICGLAYLILNLLGLMI